MKARKEYKKIKKQAEKLEDVSHELFNMIDSYSGKNSDAFEFIKKIHNMIGDVMDNVIEPASLF